MILWWARAASRRVQCLAHRPMNETGVIPSAARDPNAVSMQQETGKNPGSLGNGTASGPELGMTSGQ